MKRRWQNKSNKVQAPFMKHIAGISLLLFFFIQSMAQEPIKKNQHAVGSEIGKLGLVFNLLYDYRNNHKKWGARVVAGKNFERYLNVYQVGTGVYFLLGNKKDHLETGVDLLYIFSDEVSDDQRGAVLVFPVRNTSSLYSSGNLGYRHYGNKNMFRVGISQGYVHVLKNFYTGAYISFAWLLQNRK